MNESQLLPTLLLIAAGVGSGFINTIAGGGSLLTLPALMLLGLPADVANGTNRVSVLAQSASTVQGFHKAGHFDTAAALWILSPAAVGALIGSATASYISPALLKPILLGSMIAMAVLMVARPDSVMPPEGTQALRVRDKPLALIYLFGIGLYGGFVQAGVGFLSLMLLCGLLRYNLVQANALKIAVSGVFGIIPLIVFALAGKVLWSTGAVLAVATVVGSRVGVRFAINAKQETLRWILLGCVIAVVVAAALKG